MRAARYDEGQCDYNNRFADVIEIHRTAVRREQLNPIGAGLLLVRVRILLRMAWNQFEKEGRLS